MRWSLLSKTKIPYYDPPYDTYLVRWKLIETSWFGIFLHKILGPDPRDLLHDHPWPFAAVILRGGYDEMCRKREERGQPYGWMHRVRVLNRKRLGDFHYIAKLRRTPTWSLIFLGRHTRPWGYLDHEFNWTREEEHPFGALYREAVRQRDAGGRGMVSWE